MAIDSNLSIIPAAPIHECTCRWWKKSENAQCSHLPPAILDNISRGATRDTGRIVCYIVTLSRVYNPSALMMIPCATIASRRSGLNNNYYSSLLPMGFVTTKMVLECYCQANLLDDEIIPHWDNNNNASSVLRQWRRQQQQQQHHHLVLANRAGVVCVEGLGVIVVVVVGQR